MISSIFLLLGILFVLLGTLGLHRSKTFHARVMSSTLIDTTGAILLIIGLMLHIGFNPTSLKLGIILIVITLINPMLTHFLLLSSWKTGQKEDTGGKSNGKV
ncbi:monovalent cation/H(+) antiporter subunit G [Facklamia sp. DSM 111018]|uniref:Monovalent cation/H(+) antiporter subunit G n=1 Tax=Facklamia lactis TaxID=2749967 RepID=A0ABS0LTK4_9LACT|nr:monovalent cation/H(+) antiporter subunit G [Facklamia lactis]MBG9987287.1 monovalent cation/H(+) antiporter subunit G [Facklamia lactis]